MNFIPTNCSTPLGTIVSHFHMKCKYLSKVFSTQMYIKFYKQETIKQKISENKKKPVQQYSFDDSGTPMYRHLCKQ